MTTHIIRSEGLLSVSGLEELGNGQYVGASVHHDEEEHTSGEHPGKLWVVLETQHNITSCPYCINK